MNTGEYTTIGVAGTGKRIGTTTQSLLILQYILLNGKKSCYLEMNDSQYVKQISNVYENIFIDKKRKMVRYKNIDMYYDITGIEDIEKIDKEEGYDYYVIDYGNALNENFPKTSFFEKNIKIIVTGSKPNEIILLDLFKENSLIKNVNYIFSFTKKDKQQDILNYMRENKEKTYFAAYSPDMFYYEYMNTPIYENIFKIKLNKGDNEKI